MPPIPTSVYRTLDPTGDDRNLCQEIATASQEYTRRPAFDIKPAWRAKPLDLLKMSTFQSQWLRKIKSEGGCDGKPDLEKAHGDFVRRYDTAFKSDNPRWVMLLEPLQGSIWQEVLIEMREDVRNAGTDPEKLVILLSRTPYALFERLRRTWEAYLRKRPEDQHHPLPFPLVLCEFYLERFELAPMINNTPPPLFPSRQELEATPRQDLRSLDDLRLGWEKLLSWVHSSVTAALVREGAVEERDDKAFLERERNRCFTAFKSAESYLWYTETTEEARHTFMCWLMKIRRDTQHYGNDCGALYAIRHLRHYTAQVFDAYLLHVHGSGTLAFPGSARHPIATFTTYRPLHELGSLSHGRDMALRAGVRYGRWPKYW